MAAAAGAAARGGSIPDAIAGGHGLRLPGKPVALTDITNTGKPNPPGSIHAVADVLKENAKLRHLLTERTKVIEVSRVEMQKLRLALHAVQQKNLQLVQANSQMFAEINQGKDRLKILQHELACTIAVLKVKDSEIKKNKTAKQPQKKAKLLEIKAMPSRRAQTEAHEKATDAIEHPIQSAVPCYTSCQEHPQDETAKRCTNKWKSESCEITKDANTVQHSCKPHAQSSGPSHGDDLRKTLWRRSARLNPGSCEVTEVSYETLHEDVIVRLAPPSSSVPKQQEPNAGKDMGKLLINELPCEAVAHKLEAPELKKNERSMHTQKELYLEEIEAGSRIAGVEAHKIDNKATNTDSEHLAVTESSLLFNIEHPEASQDRGKRRKSVRIGANKRKLESCEGQMASNIEDGIHTNRHSNSSMPLHHEQKRKLSRRKSSRLDPGSCEVTNGTFDIVREDIVAHSAPSSSNVFIEQTKKDMQNGCSSWTKPPEEHVTRRSSVGRPSRRAAEKIMSYREIPLNVKMRRS